MNERIKHPLRVPLGRRSVFSLSAGFAAWAAIPRIASGASSADPRLLVVLLRGAMDGLAFAGPVGDPHYADLRQSLAIADGLPLGDGFALTPAMPQLHAMYRRKEASIAHAVATPYRGGRSHFDGQDILESGYPARGLVDSGWLYRALGALPLSTDRVALSAIAIDERIPLILRGPGEGIGNWSESGFAVAEATTKQRLLSLYERTDPALEQSFKTALELEAIANAQGGGGTVALSGYAAQAASAARFLSRQDGPRVGVLSFNGWDTHANEPPLLGKKFEQLDAALGALRDGLEPVWADTVVVVLTEFGRTVRVNGSNGSDHGTGTAAIVLGGRVRGGRIVSDWPGLSPAELLDNRDLRPTIDVRSLCKGVLRDHLGIGDAALSQNVFPQSDAALALNGLIA